MAVHSQFKRGTKIYIVTKDNEVIIGKFKESTANYIFLMDNTRVKKGDIRLSSAHKPRISNIK